MEKTTVENDLVLSLGSNLGNKEEQLRQAIEMLQLKFGNPFLISGLYQSTAWGKENQPDFLNMAVVFKTTVKPLDCLQIIHEIEHEMGRRRVPNSKWDERNIDVDILFYGSEIIDFTNLSIPHPMLPFRRFVLMPLSEIIPKHVHPVKKLNIIDLYSQCSDKGKVERLKSFI